MSCVPAGSTHLMTGEGACCATLASTLLGQDCTSAFRVQQGVRLTLPGERRARHVCKAATQQRQVAQRALHAPAGEQRWEGEQTEFIDVYVMETDSEDFLISQPNVGLVPPICNAPLDDHLVQPQASGTTLLMNVSSWAR